jgi:large subunit ribosomal protein L25
MLESIRIVAEAREERGSREARRLRRDGWLPCILNARKGKPQSLRTRRHEIELILDQHGGENVLFDLEIAGKKPKKAMLKEIQYHSVNGEMLHADLVEISMTEKMRASIPVHLTGEAAGVLEQDGILEHSLRHLEVECLPTDIPDSIDVGVKSLRIGDTITVGDIEVSSKLDILTAKDTVIASVLAPAKEEEVKPAEGAEELAEGAEPEVIGEKKEADEGDEGDSAKDKSAGEDKQE